MHERCWTATWHDRDGKRQAYTFETPDQYILAEVYLKYRLRDQGKSLPAIFELVKGPLVARSIPSLKELENRQ